MSKITEHSISINITLPKKDVHAKMETFYNPLMISNRNISILLLNAIKKDAMNMALPLAGSGIRGLRFLKELKEGKINNIFFNDKKENFSKKLTKTIKENKLTKKHLTIHNEEATLFLLNQVNNTKKPENFCGYFDYIDLDPFGTPNPFLAPAIARINRGGIIAVTATDTAALSGTYAKVTRRKYWGTSLRNYLMHEIGLRILIRKIQLQGVQFDKALIPILAYHKDHYFRIYFQNNKGKEKCDKLLKHHQYFLFNHKTLEFKISHYNKEEGFIAAGPIWTGQLKDQKLITKISKNNKFPQEEKFLSLLEEELDIPGFHDMHALAKNYNKEPTKLEPFLKKVKGTRTQFSPTGVKTKKSFKEIIKSTK